MTYKEAYDGSDPEKLRERYRQYYTENKDRINEKKKERYKTYYEENKDKINERRRESGQHAAYNKMYYQEHKDEINNDRNVKYECPCGSRYSKRNQAVHVKTKNHMRWAEEHKE